MNVEWITKTTESVEYTTCSELLGIIYKFEDRFYCYIYDNLIDKDLNRVCSESDNCFEALEIAKDIIVRFNSSITFELIDNRYVSKQLIGYIRNTEESWSTWLGPFTSCFNTLSEAKKSLIKQNISFTTAHLSTHK